MNKNVDVEQLLDEADDLIGARQYEQAIAKYTYILEHDSESADALLMRGAILGEQGKVDSAISDVEKSVAIDNTNESSYLTLAHLYKRKNNDHKVVEYSLASLELNQVGKEAEKLLLISCKKLGSYYLENSVFDKAEYYFNLMLSINSNDSFVLYRMALIVRGKGEIRESIKYAERAVQNNDNNIRFKAFIASSYEILGEIEKGSALIRELYQENKNHAFVCIVFAQYALRTKNQSDGIIVLEEMLENNDVQIHDQIDAKFLLGTLYDSIQRYDSAFEYFKQVNDMKNNGYNPSVYESYITGLISYFTKQKYLSLVTSKCPGDELIFIIGMPRSGTSLIEQILASHLDIFGAGELTHVSKMVNEIQGKELNRGYPECIDLIDQATINKLANVLLTMIGNERKTESDGRKIIDKMPHNFHHIGLLHKLFPKAKFINCVRDSRDTCLSCYFQNFVGQHSYSNDLHALGIHHLEYERLMRHWRENLGIPILTVSYESVVENSRIEVKKILDFLELCWDENCLEFYKQKRTVATSSYNQVNKKIYNRSVGRWKNYESHIGDLLNVLRVD